MDQTISSTDKSLRRRALKVVPGGMFGHLNAALLPEAYPQFFASGQGCRIRDVDGREYIDFMCSWGPIILGHRHPEVEAAALRQQEQGDCLNGPTERFVELAERLTARIEHADWVQYQKNGTDATTVSVMIARAARRRRKILVARGAYHGTAPWCALQSAGIAAEDQAHLIHFRFNDIESVERAVERAGDDLAGIVVSAYRHDLGFDQELPTPAFATRLRELCDEKDAALILDDVRAGFRLADGCSWELLGVQPDLSAWSKAIANGYALAAIAGSDRYREAASRVFATGSFWCSGVSMAAALATLDVLERNDGVAHMRAMGEMLREGMAAQAERHGVGIRQSGPAQMPTILFENDPDFRKGFLFVSEGLSRGVYMHPKHNMFLSMAHTAEDINLALEATDAAFRAVARFGG